MPTYKGHRGIVRLDGTTAESWLNYTCPFCGGKGGIVVAYVASTPSDQVRWLQCAHCGKGAVLNEPEPGISPAPLAGLEVGGLPDIVARTYTEARRCLSIAAFNASEMVCRKILMHVAVEKATAKEGDTFASYIEHLERAGYVTPPMKRWVKLIKDNANETTHKLPAPDPKRAESTLLFTGELLRLVYEMEALADEYSGKQGS